MSLFLWSNLLEIDRLLSPKVEDDLHHKGPIAVANQCHRLKKADS